MLVHDAWGNEGSDYASLGLASSAATPQSPAVKALKNKLRPEIRQESALDQLEAEMKLLQWHKLANDQALKAALIKTKNLRNKDRAIMSTRKSTGNDMELEEKVVWMQQIIEEEQSKPLQVSKHFVLQYEQKEYQRQEKLDSAIVRHVDNLKRIRKQMDAQVDLRQRQQDFRKWKVERAPIKKAVMQGKAVTARSWTQGSSDPSPRPTSLYTQQTGLETVLQSLNKLEQLEERIATLERNKAAKQVAIHSGKTGTVKAEVKFSKRRMDPLAGNPARAVYTVRLHEGMTNKVGTAVRRQPVRQPIPKAGAHISAEKYLRSLPNLHAQGQQDPKRQAMRAHERQMKMSLTSGQSTLRSRMKSKQQQEQQRQQNQQRHRAAVKAMDANRSKPHVIRPKVNVQASKGAAAGRRHANQSMQEFDDIRKMHQRRREALNRQSTHGSLKTEEQTSRPRAQQKAALSRTAPQRRPVRNNASLSRSTTHSKASSSRDNYPVVGAGVGGIRALRRR